MEDEEDFEDDLPGDQAPPQKLPSRRMMPIRPFRAWDDEGDPCEVVGVTYTGDDRGSLEFVVVVDVDGEVFPSIREIVLREDPGKAETPEP